MHIMNLPCSCTMFLAYSIVRLSSHDGLRMKTRFLMGGRSSNTNTADYLGLER